MPILRIIAVALLLAVFSTTLFAQQSDNKQRIKNGLSFRLSGGMARGAGSPLLGPEYEYLLKPKLGISLGAYYYGAGMRQGTLKLGYYQSSTQGYFLMPGVNYHLFPQHNKGNIRVGLHLPIGMEKMKLNSMLYYKQGYWETRGSLFGTIAELAGGLQSPKGAVTQLYVMAGRFFTQPPSVPGFPGEFSPYIFQVGFRVGYRW